MNDSLSVVIALTAGVLSFLSPCVLPLVPSYLSFVTGMTVDDLQETDRSGRTHALVHASLFVLGFTAVFMILGASASFLGAFFRVYEDWIARIGGLIVLVLGLHLMGVLRIVPLMRERRVQLADRPAGHLGSVAVGAAFGAGWTPCIGPVLGGILTLAGTGETVWSGMALLGAYSAGLAIPFLLAALALDRFFVHFRRVRRFVPLLEKGSGLLLVLLGILLLTGSFTVLTGWLARFTPDWILERV